MNKKSILEGAGEDDPVRVYKTDLSNRSIREIVLVKEFEKMRCLVLSYNLITRIENLQCFPDLRELHIESNGLQRLQGLEGNRSLQVLNLRNNRIDKIQNIGHLIKLQTLILDNNVVKKISGLQYLKDLKNLYVSHNNIETLQNLPAFSKLQYCDFSHNKIKNLPSLAFSSSKGLTILDLSHNRIEVTSFLQSLTSLKSLNLSHNKIREFQVNPMPNLQSLNLSENQIQKLAPLGTSFPELVSLDISSNMICSEFELLSALAETEYLTELDFRNNPMFTENFEEALQKVHCFDFLNGRPMTKAGAKYYQKIVKIQEDLQENRQFYGEDDEQDRQLKMSGFYDQQLQFKMSGTKVDRPVSPPKKKKMFEKPTFYEDIDRMYHQFSENDLRIKVLREQYLKICGEYNIKGSEHILTELPPDSSESTLRAHSQEQKVREEPKRELSQQLANTEIELRKQNQKTMNKWKQLKQREKNFNIREVIRKSRGKDNSINRGMNSSSNSNWTGINGFKGEKMKSELLRTQAVPKKMNEELFKTMIRPRSTHKKE